MKRDGEASVIQLASLISPGSSNYFCALRDRPKKQKGISFIIINPGEKALFVNTSQCFYTQTIKFKINVSEESVFPFIAF